MGGMSSTSGGCNIFVDIIIRFGYKPTLQFGGKGVHNRGGYVIKHV